MKFSAFKEGIDILGQYIEPDDVCALCAQHDEFLIGPATQDKVTEAEAARLEELGWLREDEGDGWKCFT